MVQKRDARGRFVGELPYNRVYEPITLSEGALAVLRGLPEICDVAEPGQRLGEAECAPGHYLVRFWPLLLQGRPGFGPCWELTPPMIYDIDTTSPPDRGNSSADADSRGYNNHMAKPVHMRMGEGGKLGNGGFHILSYDAYGYNGQDTPGMLCRGNSKFSNDPFQCTMMLRMWHIQTLENRGQASRRRSNVRDWWRTKGEEWLLEYPYAKAVLVPSVAANVIVARAIPLDRAWVEAMQQGTWNDTLPYVIPPATVEKVEDGQVVV